MAQTMPIGRPIANTKKSAAREKFEDVLYVIFLPFIFMGDAFSGLGTPKDRLINFAAGFVLAALLLLGLMLPFYFGLSMKWLLLTIPYIAIVTIVGILGWIFDRMSRDEPDPYE